MSKTLLHKILCDYVRPKYYESANHFYMDIERFIIHVKQMIFTKTLKKMLKQGLAFQIMNQVDDFIKKKYYWIHER